MSVQSPKILFVCTEDWFCHSHFLPLVRAAKRIEGSSVALVATASGKHVEIEQLGVRIIPLDFDRASLNIMSAVRLVRQLHGVFWREKPDIIHFIALNPIILGGLAVLDCIEKRHGLSSDGTRFVHRERKCPPSQDACRVSVAACPFFAVPPQPFVSGKSRRWQNARAIWQGARKTHDYPWRGRGRRRSFCRAAGFAK